MYTVDVSTMTALMSGTAEMTYKCTCITPTQSVDIPVVDDQAGVQSTNQTQVTRSGVIVVTRDITDSGLLSPLTDHVYVRCAVRGLPDIPLMYGRVVSQEENEQGHVNVKISGQINDVIQDDFAVPWATGGASATQEAALIMHDVDASISVTVDDNVPNVVPPIQVWAGSRGQALTDLLSPINANMQDARAGGARIYLNPFSIPNPVPTGIVLSDGINGTLVTVTYNKSRDSIFNSITITSTPMQDANGQQGIPITVTVRDTDPTSLTRYGGPFGKRNKNYSIQSSLLGPDLKVLALQVLRQSLALSETWTITTPFMPLLDPDDVFGVVFNGVTHTLVVESVQHNGSAGTSTSITARKLQYLSEPQLAQ